MGAVEGVAAVGANVEGNIVEGATDGMMVTGDPDGKLEVGDVGEEEVGKDVEGLTEDGVKLGGIVGK